MSDRLLNHVVTELVTLQIISVILLIDIEERTKNCVDAPYETVKEHIIWVAEKQDAKSYKAGRADAARQIFEEIETTMFSFPNNCTYLKHSAATSYVLWQALKEKWEVKDERTG